MSQNLGQTLLDSFVIFKVVQSGGKNIELAVMRRDQPLKILNPEEIEKYVAEIEKEKEENEKKKQKKAS